MGMARPLERPAGGGARPGFSWDLSQAAWIAEHLGSFGSQAKRELVDLKNKAEAM